MFLVERYFAKIVHSWNKLDFDYDVDAKLTSMILPSAQLSIFLKYLLISLMFIFRKTQEHILVSLPDRSESLISSASKRTSPTELFS